MRLYLEEKNFWTRHSVKVELTREVKIILSLPTAPRAEIDLVAYNPIKDEIILIEAKSYLNSAGVTIGGLSGTNAKTKDRYRLLNNPTYRRIVTARLKADFIKKSIIKKTTKIKYALAAGQVQKKSMPAIKAYLKKKRFMFFSPEDIKRTIKSLAEKGWDDNVVIVTVKLTK